MRGEFNFSKNINKTLLFDTSKINEEVIMDKIFKSLNDPLNDEYYIEHPDGTNAFTLKPRSGRLKSNWKSKVYIYWSKDWSR